MICFPYDPQVRQLTEDVKTKYQNYYKHRNFLVPLFNPHLGVWGS